MSTISSDKELIDITPDITLMPKLAFAGYSAPQAIAELVDNAIDARLTEKLLVVISIGKDVITVADNGSGMDRDEVSQALVLAHSEKKDKLGEFGLGMKTACLSLGDSFEILTSKHTDPYQYRISFDKKEWEKKKRWTLPLERSQFEAKDHFTIVSINKLKIFYPNLPANIRQDLQRRYAPFIRSNEVEIKVNGKPCIPEAITLLDGSRKDFNIKLRGDNVVYGWHGLLKEGSQKGFYGFDTFRRGRMITTFDKIGFDAHPTLARIVGVIHMDHVPVMTTKRGFERESSEYKEVVSALRHELTDLVKRARRKASQDTTTSEVKNSVSIWKDRITEALRDDVFKAYTTRLKEDKFVKSKYSALIKDVEVEKRNPHQKQSEQASENIGTKTRTPEKTHVKKRHVIKIKGKTITFDHDFAPLGVEAGWKTWNYSAEKGLEIFSNTDFPAYFSTKDKAFYAVIHIAEAISEFFIKVAEEDTINTSNLKEEILRKAAQLKEQIDS